MLSLLSRTKNRVNSNRWFRERPANASRCTLRLLAWLALAFIATGTLAACGDDDDPGATQDFGELSLALEANSSFAEQPDLLEFSDPNGTVYTLTSARLVIEEIDFELPDGIECGDVEDQLSGRVECDSDVLQEDEIQVGGPFIFDLVTGESTPSLANVTIPAIDYVEIDVHSKPLEEEDDLVGTNDRLLEESIVFEADFEFEGNKRELLGVFSFDEEAVVQTGDEDMGFDIRDGDTLVLAFDLANWLDEIPVTQCLRDGDLKSADGRVLIDEDVSGECDAAGDDFEENWEDSLSPFLLRP